MATTEAIPGSELLPLLDEKWPDELRDEIRGIVKWEVVRSTASLQERLCRAVCRVASLEEIIASPRPADGSRPPIQFRSQFCEDVYLWKLFDRKPQGFFIEAGAFDGVKFSVTYALEALGWSGILVEGIPDKAAAAGRSRPNSTVFNCILSEPGHPETDTFNVLQDQYGGMLSYYKTTPAHQRELDKCGNKSERVTVPVHTLDEILAGFPGQQVDVLVLDVDGWEIPCLRGLDIAWHRPRVMLIEDNTQTTELIEYMREFPYTHVDIIGMNRVYIRNDEPVLLRRAFELQTLAEW